MKASVYLRFIALEERLDRIEALLVRLNDDQDDRATATELTKEVDADSAALTKVLDEAPKV